MDLETSQALLSMQRIILVNSGTNIELKVCKCSCCSKNEDKVQDRKVLTSSKNENPEQVFSSKSGVLKNKPETPGNYWGYLQHNSLSVHNT